jgi:Predicted membrane protein
MVRGVLGSHSSPPAPGVERPKRFRPKFHYELLVCGTRGHQLVGTDVGEIRPQDSVVVRERDGVRWHRCLRCDSWLPLSPPQDAPLAILPPLERIPVPVRGRALRDKIVLRAIAIDRGIHFVVLAFLGVLVFFVAAHEHELQHRFYRVLADIQGGVGGGPVQSGHTGILHDLDQVFTLRSRTLHLLGVGVFAYAAVEGAEAVGLWYQRRWAEYLTFVATAVFLPLEVYELTRTVSPFKVVALLLNLAIVIYLVSAKRLFGFRGGAAAEQGDRERDVGWPALRRTEPGDGAP